jgi:hypothetical protein
MVVVACVVGLLTAGCSAASEPPTVVSESPGDTTASETVPSEAPATEAEPVAVDPADVDVVLDYFIAGTRLLSEIESDSLDGVLAQIQQAEDQWAMAGAALRAGIPGLPQETSIAVLDALDPTLEAMTAYLDCMRGTDGTGCEAESDATAENAQVLGEEVSALVPFGTRSASEYVAALEGAAEGTQDATAEDTGSETVSQSNAREKAASYLEFSAFSREGLIEQLEYEGFSQADAEYAADAVGADWNEQAALKAQQYLDVSAFSRKGLIEQLEYEGFTKAQATYGADAVGL